MDDIAISAAPVIVGCTASACDCPGCPTCGGSGTLPGGRTCGTCGGSGRCSHGGGR
ncbi:hypothetical protein [Actinomadura opuntiae]|uniref:hypothetical protein n=1 Tax=Actinomadura sp. OS1-43 TaxID=604315 RepID=UPI00255B3F3D|nr:hypothetical protein [Actinomadura sp. OS1-43]MDL4815116.1 hypothetical protein [Actinomadura sp. OS1-43]